MELIFKTKWCSASTGARLLKQPEQPLVRLNDWAGPRYGWGAHVSTGSIPGGELNSRLPSSLAIEQRHAFSKSRVRCTISKWPECREGPRKRRKWTAAGGDEEAKEAGSNPWFKILRLKLISAKLWKERWDEGEKRRGNGHFRFHIDSIDRLLLGACLQFPQTSLPNMSTHDVILSSILRVISLKTPASLTQRHVSQRLTTPSRAQHFLARQVTHMFRTRLTAGSIPSLKEKVTITSAWLESFHFTSTHSAQILIQRLNSHSSRYSAKKRVNAFEHRLCR